MIPIETLDVLRDFVARADAALPAAERAALVARAERRLPTAKAVVRAELLARSLSPIGEEIVARHGRAGRVAFAAAFVAHLALRRAPLLGDSCLPASVLAMYPAAYARLADYLRTADLSTYWVGDDAFLKDLRFSAGYSIPCGAEDVDLVGTIPMSSVIKSMVMFRDLRTSWALLRAGSTPWYRIHTDQRYLGEFNEPGWDRCYLRIAEMLTREPEVKGVVGTSWFFDPQLLEISPRLAYLQTHPLKRGAMLLRHGSGAFHTEHAISKSPTRRKLYEEGRYLPVCYSLIWPRVPLITWARSVASTNMGLPNRP
jgi:hypothetical protein